MSGREDSFVSTAPLSLRQRIARAAELAAPIYAAHGWTWRRNGEDRHVPTVGEIALEIERLYQEVASDGEPKSLGTGRLYVAVDEDDGSISVEVELAELRDPEED